jgi:hypothetical protein
MKSADPGKVIVSVPQLFSGGGNLRAPTRNEVLSSAYLSLVVGARGVVYYYSGPIWRSEEPLYTFHDETEWFERMFSLDSMDPEKIAALKTFASFINAPSGEQDGATNGDLLARFGVDKYYIVGTTDGLDRVNSRAFRSGELGTSSRADIAGISIVDESGNIVGDRNLVGLAHLADNSSRPNTTYYLVANMNASDSDVNLRIAFRSSNSRSFLRVSNLTYPDLLSDLVMSRTDAVQTRLPAHAAMILRIENID